MPVNFRDDEEDQLDPVQELDDSYSGTPQPRNLPVPDPIPDPAPKLPDIYGDTMKDYEPKIKEAEGTAKWKEAAIMALQALGSATPMGWAQVKGIKRPDSSAYYKALMESVRAEPGLLKDERDTKIKSMLGKDKLERETVERGQTDKAFGWKEGDQKNKEDQRTRKQDEQSKAAESLRAILGGKIAADPTLSREQKLAAIENSKGMQYDEMADLLKQYDSGNGSLGAGERPQQLSITEGDGVSRLGRFVNGNYEVVGDDGKWRPAKPGASRVYAAKIIGDTGQSFLPGSNVTSTVYDAAGNPVRDSIMDAKGDAALQSGLGTAEAKATSEAAATKASLSSREGFATNWTAKRAAANQEQMAGMIPTTGPISGRVADVVRGAGYSTGANSDALDRDLKREAAVYIQERTGLASTDAEYQRLLSLAPKNTDDDELFETNMKGFLDEVDRGAERKVKAAENIGAVRQGANIRNVDTPSQQQAKSPDTMSAPELKTEIEKFGMLVTPEALVDYKLKNKLNNHTTEQVLRELLKDVQEQ